MLQQATNAKNHIPARRTTSPLVSSAACVGFPKQPARHPSVHTVIQRFPDPIRLLGAVHTSRGLPLQACNREKESTHDKQKSLHRTPCCTYSTPGTLAYCKGINNPTSYSCKTYRAVFGATLLPGGVLLTPIKVPPLFHTWSSFTTASRNAGITLASSSSPTRPFRPTVAESTTSGPSAVPDPRSTLTLSSPNKADSYQNQ